MDESSMLEQFEEVARSLGIEIRYEALKGEGTLSPGGLCRLQGKYLLIINSKATRSEKIGAIATAVNRFDLSQIYLRPGLREFLERFPKQKEKSPPSEQK